MSLTRTDRIPIPWKRRLQRLQRTALPVASFFACVFLTLWLWQRQGQMPNAVGEVEAVRIDVAAGEDGILVPLSSGQWTLFDRVEANTVIARLDDRPVRAEMATLMAEVARLRSQWTAAEEQIQLEQSGRKHDYQREYRRLVWKSQQHRLDVLDRRATIEADRIEEMRLDKGIAFLILLREKGTVTDMQIADQRLKRDEVRKRIQENEKFLNEAKRQLDETTAALQNYNDMPKASVDKLLQPLEAAIMVGSRRLDELQLRITGLEIRSPISGTICAIHRWPGQSLRAGDPIVTVAADQGRYIMSYVRQEQRLRPSVGMPVELRVRGTNGRAVTTVVDRLGPQIESVPEHHRQNVTRPEWGQPIFIRIPSQLALRPGELVDVMFDTSKATNPGRPLPESETLSGQKALCKSSKPQGGKVARAQFSQASDKFSSR